MGSSSNSHAVPLAQDERRVAVGDEALPGPTRCAESALHVDGPREVAEAEVRAQVVLGEIAPTRSHLPHPAPPSGHDAHARADGEGVEALLLQSKADPVMAGRLPVLKQRGD